MLGRAPLRFGRSLASSARLQREAGMTKEPAILYLVAGGLRSSYIVVAVAT
jgi:hypothetical protein